MLKFNYRNIYYKEEDQQRKKSVGLFVLKFPLWEIFNIKLGDTRI